MKEINAHFVLVNCLLDFLVFNLMYPKVRKIVHRFLIAILLFRVLKFLLLFKTDIFKTNHVIRNINFDL